MRRITILFLFILTQLFIYCGGKNEKEKETSSGPDISENILGKWSAHWEMTGDEVKDYPAKQKKMSGKMNFYGNGEVQVTTYGFDGCIFMPDTSSNTMNWKIENQVLRFMDKKDVHGIPYSIERFTNKEIQLSIMENIHLTLKR